ncbi:hypothetical protein [Vibrio metschnikovii]|uniref:hypothetical protein n=1 Tax=Vibrio metschnikovii TaxID=28172 RepID=UPI001C2F4A03|nr:hypothetical protein [Vibrio metschnikovii]
MGFSNEIYNFAQDSIDMMKQIDQEKTEQANNALIAVMGDQLNTITSITFDLEVGKFKDVEAPEYSKELLRKANLLIE